MSCIDWTGVDMGCVAGGVADSAVEKLTAAIGDGLKTALQYVSSFWMEVPDPTVATGSGNSWHGAQAITSMQGYLMPITAAVCVISFAMALARIGFDTDRASEGFKGIGRQMFAVVMCTVPTLAITQLLLEFGDAFSPYIMDKGAGTKASDGFGDLLVGGLLGSDGAWTGTNGVGMYLFIFILALIGSLVQCVFMVIRAGAIIVLVVVLPLVAAGAATEEGWARVKRIWALLFGFVSYKVVAAIIYGTGLRLMSDGQSAGDEVQNALYGLTIITMAALALPAFIKFVMPAAAMGSSSAFSGGAAVGAVAAGAAIVSLAGAGAGGAAAGGAAKGAGGSAGGGAGGMAGTTAQGAGDVAGGSAGGATGGGAPGGGSGGSGGPGGGPDGPGGSGSGADGASSSNGDLQSAASEGSSAAGAEPASPTGGSAQAAGGSDSSTSTTRKEPPRRPSGAPQTAPRSNVRGAVTEAAKSASQQISNAGDEAAEGAQNS